MRTDLGAKSPVTHITASDRELLHRLLDRLGPLAKLHELRRYKALTSDEVWHALVTQVCVMGSARGIDALERGTDRDAFRQSVSLATLAKKRRPAQHLEQTLRVRSATRFPRRSARVLHLALSTPGIVRDGTCVLLEGLAHTEPANVTRQILLERCPLFKLKSASDFMITVGLSRNVIALDVRVVGALRKYLDFNLSAGQVQSRAAIYLSVEDALREVCAAHKSTLAHLDRSLFQFAGMSALEFVLQHAL